MGNYRFRLSDMMPNAWFYKLKDMGRTRSHNNSLPIKKKHPTAAASTQLAQPRQSYYFSTEPSTGDRFCHSPVNPKVSDTHFPDPPRKSSKRRPKKRTTTVRSSPKLVSSSVSAGCRCRATLDSVWTKSDSTPDYVSPIDSSPEPVLLDPFLPKMGSDHDSFDGLEGLASWSSSCSCRFSSSTTDIIIDVDKTSYARKFEKIDGGFDPISELELPPILTKPAKFNDMIRDVGRRGTTEQAKIRRSSTKLQEGNAHGSASVKIVEEESSRAVKEQRNNSSIRRSSTISPRLKLKSNSPRLASRKLQAYGRKSVSSTTSSRLHRRSLSENLAVVKPRNLSESLAVVKSSCDPRRDFRDSMVEMIVENNIRASKDLEELLACYLSLNSDEYHDLIVKVFEQIWFDLTDIRL